jgi:hypothetical protein
MKLIQHGLMIAPTETEEQDLWHWEARSKVLQAFNSVIREHILAYLAESEPFTGKAVSGEVLGGQSALDKMAIDLLGKSPELRDVVFKMCAKAEEHMEFESQDDYDTRAKDGLSQKMAKVMGIDLTKEPEQDSEHGGTEDDDPDGDAQ